MKKQSLAKRLGISGVKGQHIEKAFHDMNLDPEVVDWKTLGEEAADYGDNYGAIWDKLENEYGISKPQTWGQMNMDIDRYEEQDSDEAREHQLGRRNSNMCFDRHFARSPRARAIDESLPAKKVFEPTNQEGVDKWMKEPNRFDIHGIDFFGKKKTKKPRKKKRKKKR